MPDPTLVISIDHAGPYPVAGAVAPLVFSGSDGSGDFGIVRFREPAVEPEVTYADRGGNHHGDIATAWRYPDVVHDWAFVTDEAGDEPTSRSQLAVVRAFLVRLQYAMTITVAGAPPETWSCKPGSLSPASDRDRNDLADGNPVWNVNLPAHPIRTV